MRRSAKNIDFTEGKLFPSIFAFVVPLVLTGILQCTYHIADKVVVGLLSGDTLALAAVGSSASLVSVIINMLVSLSAGCNVVTAQARGRGDREAVTRAVHTSMTFAAIGGLVLMVIALAITRPFLTWLDTKPELMSRAIAYMSISCLGIPASSVYNFGASAMRSFGDTKTSLKILAVSGLINVVFNVIFVVGFHMAASGVAIATVISQYVSAIALVYIMIRRKDEPYSIHRESIGIDGKMLKSMLRFGVPTAVQTSMFSISNVLLTGATNSLTTLDISAKTIVNTITELLNNTTSSYTHAAVTASAQNYGAGKIDRIGKAVKCSILQSFSIVFSAGLVITAINTPVIKMFIDATDPNMGAIVDIARDVLILLSLTYFIVGIYNLFAGALRGMGYTLAPMITCVACICGFRILWIYTAFRTEPLHSLFGLHLSYPISWTVTSIVLGIIFAIVYRRVKREHTSSQNSL